MASDHGKRVYVRDTKGRFADTGMLNKKLKGVARDLFTTSGTSLDQRITFRNHGITSERDKKKVVGHYKAMLKGHRKRNAGKLLGANGTGIRVVPKKKR